MSVFQRRIGHPGLIDPDRRRLSPDDLCYGHDLAKRITRRAITRKHRDNVGRAINRAITKPEGWIGQVAASRYFDQPLPTLVDRRFGDTPDVLDYQVKSTRRYPPLLHIPKKYVAELKYLGIWVDPDLGDYEVLGWCYGREAPVLGVLRDYDDLTRDPVWAIDDYKLHWLP